MKGFHICKSPVIGELSKLSFFELGKEIDFEIKRIYYIYDLKLNDTRGFHAHKHLKQVLFSPYGEIEIELDNGTEKIQTVLDSPEKLLIIDQCLWRTFTALKDGSVLCVGASETYSEEDYIRDYNSYIRWVTNESSV